MDGSRTLPTGTVTFLFTDIEGSTRLLNDLGDDYPDVLATHDRLLREAIDADDGIVVGTEGDSFFAVFASVGGAVGAAVRAQRALADEAWPDGHQVRVRMGLHTGEGRLGGENYVGIDVNRAARISAAGNGGQVLLSAATHGLVRSSLPDGVQLRDLGEHRLKDLPAEEHLWQLDIDGLETEFPPLRTLSSAKAHLPAQLSSFVGRAEVDAVKSLTETARLVTLTGPGGTGKTRLSVQVASEIAYRYNDGTYFVELDAVTDPDLVASEIASTLALASSPATPLERVIEHLRDRTVLLVLDNLEQVIDSAPSISRIIKECASVSVIASSRIPLHIRGEQEFPVPALGVPSADAGTLDAERAGEYEAVRLFVERAAAARPDFELDDANAPVIVDIVSRLDGLPLAIELAAARMRVLPLEALRSRLDTSLLTLSGGARDVAERQRTLRAAIEWSHDLLDEPDQRLFARFSVVAGGARLDEAEAICGSTDELGRDVLDGLESLADQSLVQAVSQDAEPRFSMLATIREFAGERLDGSGEADAIRARHAEAYVALAEAAAPHLLAIDGKSWNDRLEADHDNLRAALDWIVDEDRGELGLRIIAALWRFWQVRGHLAEGAERCGRILALPSVHEQAPEVRARAESAAGGIAYWRLDHEGTYQHYSAALDQARRSGDKSLLAAALYDAGFQTRPEETDTTTRFGEGRPFWEEAIELYRELDDTSGIARCLWALSFSSAADGDLDATREQASQSLELSREIEDPFLIGWGAYLLGQTSVGLGFTDEAADQLGESMDVWSAAGDKSGMLLCVVATAMLAGRRGHAERRWRLIGAAQRLKVETGAELAIVDIPILGFDVRREPETDEQRGWLDAGRPMTLEEAVASAREELADRG